MSEIPRYKFPRHDPAGLVGTNLGLLQALVILGAVGTSLLVLQNLGGQRASLIVVAVIVGSAAALAFLPIQGRAAVNWLPIALAWRSRRRPQTSTAPTRGHVLSFARLGAKAGGAGQLPDEFGDVEVISWSADEYGVIVDRKLGRYSAVLTYSTNSFGLLGEGDQARAIAAWGECLASTAREGSPVCRLQWIESTIPSTSDEIAEHYRGARDESVRDHGSVESYLQLIDQADTATNDHTLHLVLQIDSRRAFRQIKQMGGSSIDDGACQLLHQEVQQFLAGMQRIDGQAGGWLKARTIGKIIRLWHDPYSRHLLERLGVLNAEEAGVSPADSGALGRAEEWDHYKTDGTYHATYYICEWPARPVGPTFLVPLLLHTQMARKISVTMEPIPPSRAQREVAAQIASDRGDQRLREKHGFEDNAQRAKRRVDLLERDNELAAGHRALRFSGYITVSAISQRALERQTAELEQRAGQAQLQVRRMYGEQGPAAYYTMPLARGLADL